MAMRRLSSVVNSLQHPCDYVTSRSVFSSQVRFNRDCSFVLQVFHCITQLSFGETEVVQFAVLATSFLPNVPL